MKTTGKNSKLKVGVVFLGRRRPGFDMEWGKVMEQSVRGWLQKTEFDLFEPGEKALDDPSLRRVMAACQEQRVDAIVLLQTTLSDGRLAPTIAQFWPDPLILWATPENQSGDMISSCSLVGTHVWASTLRHMGHPFELVYGDPAAAAPHPQCRQIIEQFHCGVLLPDWSDTAFVNGLDRAKRIFNTDEWDRMVANGIAAFQDELNWEAQFEKLKVHLDRQP